MKHLAGYAPIMSYPYCWQPQESSLFLVYFKSNHVTNQYNNLSPDKFMPLSLLLVMPTMNHEEYPMPQEAATRGGAIAMDADDSDETTLDTSETRSAKRLRPTKSNAPVLPHYRQLRIKMTQQQALLTPNHLPMMTPR